MESIKGSFKLIRKPNLGPRPSRIGIISIFLICLLGASAAGLVGFNARQTYIANHEGRTKSIAEALPFSELNSLKGNPDDTKQPNYTTVKDRLKRIKYANDDIRFAYITVMKDNKIIFAVDSEDPNSDDYSPPGQQYGEASLGFYQAFQNQATFFEGPYKDHWGTWMSSEAPIYNPENGQFIGMLGIDSPVDRYYTDVISRILIPILIALTASLLLWKIDHVRRKQEEILRLKNQFVSIASHELRSPLTGMLWAIQSLLKDKSTTHKQAGVLREMFQSTETSMATINEILDLSVFERTRPSKLQKVEMDLNAAAREVVKNLKLNAHERHVKLEALHLDQSAPLMGDPSAIKRSLMNILSNAIKYSRENTAVRITFRKHGDTYHLTIVDRGIGIPKGDQRKVLRGYFRSKNAVKMQSTGTGLGLYVTKLIIEQHGGALKLVSVENHGTSVSVQLPVYKKLRRAA